MARRLRGQARVELRGADVLRRNLRRLERTTRAAVVNLALLHAAEPVRVRAAANAPRSDVPGGSRGKGHAADHIEKAVVADREVHVGPEEDFWYLVFAEFGTPYRSASAPLRRAADSEFNTAVRRFAQRMSSEIRMAIR